MDLVNSKILLSPPVAFIIVLASVLLFSKLLSKLSYKHKGPVGDMEKSYACGEDVPTNLIQPDYSQFFPFAFFFTILHVVTLIIATVPKPNTEILSIGILYIAGAVVGLSILFRR